MGRGGGDGGDVAEAGMSISGTEKLSEINILFLMKHSVDNQPAGRKTL